MKEISCEQVNLIPADEIVEWEWETGVLIDPYGIAYPMRRIENNNENNLYEEK